MSSGAIRFNTVPSQGFPQEAPESPLIYAEVVEDLIDKVECRLRRSGRPAGVRLQNEYEPCQVEQYKTRAKYFSQRDSAASVQFADDTYIWARSMLMLEFQLSVLASVFASAGQKFEISTDARGLPCERGYAMPPLLDCRRAVHVRNDRCATPTARKCRSQHESCYRNDSLGRSHHERPRAEGSTAVHVQSWLKYSKIRNQLQHRYTPLRRRVKLMDAVLLPALL